MEGCRGEHGGVVGVGCGTMEVSLRDPVILSLCRIDMNKMNN